MLLIDAVNEVARERATSFLKPEHQERIEAAYRAYADEEDFARVATLADIAAQNFSLSIPLYVKRAVNAASNASGSQPSLRETWEAWEASGRTFWEEMDAVVDLLDGLVADDAEAANG